MKKIKNKAVRDYVLDELAWKCDLPGFLKELSENTIGTPYGITFRILRMILQILSARAIEINDPALNIIMSNLSLYDGSHTKEIIAKVEQERNKIREIICYPK